MTKKRLIRFDWAMKYILRNKANFDILECFLSNLLKETIKIESLLESESNRGEETRKFNRVDLMCLDAQGRRIIIEIQNQREADYLQRLLWGTSQAVAENLELGSAYKGVVKVISISILYFTISNEQEYIYKGQMEFRGVHTHNVLQIYDKKLTAVAASPILAGSIFPEYYLIDVERFEDIINEELDEWIYFFKHGEIRSDFTSPGILLASMRLDLLAMDPQERKNYESYLADLASERDILSTAMEEGWVKGKAEGRAEGHAEGEAKAKRATAQRLLAIGMSIEDVANMTELSVDDIGNQ